MNAQEIKMEVDHALQQLQAEALIDGLNHRVSRLDTMRKIVQRIPNDTITDVLLKAAEEALRGTRG